MCLFVCLFVDFFVCCFNYCGTPTESFPEIFVKIQLDLAKILRIRKLDWHDGGGEKKGRGMEGILLCHFQTILGHPQEVTLNIS